MLTSCFRHLLLLCLVPLLAAAAEKSALPFVASALGEHMVLQRHQPIHLWGWTQPEEKITGTLAQETRTTKADANGRWDIEFAPLPAGGPHTLTIDGSQKATFSDVLIGDVWLCGGQSNMEFSLTRADGGAAEVAQSSNPNLRLFRVPTRSAYSPAPDAQGRWVLSGPEAFAQPGGFSAVAYYFGKKLQAETGVPIGLIQVAVGGTPAESWMSRGALESFSEFRAALDEMERLRKKDGPVYGNFVMPWYDEFDRGVAENWSAAHFDATHWKPVSLHDAFARLGVGETPAVVWLQRKFTLPKALPSGTAKLLLGVVEKMDTAWINGQWIGASAWVENPRAYSIPSGTLHEGENVLTVRILKTAAEGGFRSRPEDLKLELADGTSLPLEDAWRATVSVDARPPHPLPLSYENWPTMPTVLHAGMLAPLGPLAVTGAIWYQGEANFTRAAQYRTLLPAMIADWRALFHQPAMPFYLVQLPAFMAHRAQPGGTDGWTALRDAQAHTAEIVPQTALAITLDTGDADNIHPTDKAPVGDRLARLALKNIYDCDVVASGPTFDRAEKIAGALRLHFAHTDGGLVSHGTRLGEFSVAGEDRAWHWAEAKIEGDTVVVSSPAVPEPVAARYAWQANPLATLFNGAGLPAAPFRTDDWPLREPR